MIVKRDYAQGGQMYCKNCGVHASWRNGPDGYIKSFVLDDDGDKIRIDDPGISSGDLAFSWAHRWIMSSKAHKNCIAPEYR